MKNLLSENMLRFGTKNLSEAAQKELTLKSILETIDQYGLQKEVRKALTEADAPKKDFAFPKELYFPDGEDARRLGIKIKPSTPNADGYSTTDYGPLVWQSDTSLNEASAILQQLIKILSEEGTDNGPALAKVLGKISANNYYAILWKVRYGSSFKSITKSNYATITDWISKFGFDIPSTAKKGGSGSGYVAGGNPAGVMRNWFQDPTIHNAVQRLKKYNDDEGRNTSF